MRPATLIRVAIVTFGGVGFFPIASGTAGSAAAAAVAYGLDAAGWGSWRVLLGMAAVASALNVILGPWIVRHFRRKDPSPVVIDEVAGQWLCLAVPLRTLHPWLCYPLAFFLFRIFDVLKPFGARRLESLPHGWGILLDDLLCAIYVALLLLLVGVLLG